MANTHTKTALTFVFVLLLCVAGTDAWSQAKLGFDLRSGLATPVGDFNDGFHLGVGFHSSVYVEFSPVAAAGLGGGFNWFTLDSDIAGPGFDTDGGNPSIINLCPELRFMVGTADMPTFAFVVGAGYYRLSQSDLTVTEVGNPSNSMIIKFDAVDKFGINTAGKVVFPVAPNIKLGVESMFHLIFTSEDDPLQGPDYNTTFFDFMAVLVVTGGT
ncbi:MAG: hypothetical protein JSW58_03800 [Candidatus Latescibacterota bacterium]|nr:MAG: hypothetical protein JSW58_03800 [Candidatus Latescibacterota bacterium]